MTINAISASMAANMYIAENELPRWIISKLEELGINPEGITSTGHAKELIQKAEESKSKEQNQDQDQDNNSELRKRAVELAEKTGVKVKNSDTTDDIIKNIENVLDKALKIAVSRNDEALYNTIKAYKQQLDGIIADNNGGSISNSIVYSFMDMVAQQNKYALNLNKNR